MKNIKHTINTTLLNEGIQYIEKNPIQNFTKLLDWAKKIPMKSEHKEVLAWIKQLWSDPKNNWSILIRKVLSDLHPNVRKKFILNFFGNSVAVGIPMTDKNRLKYHCNIPWAILLDPTSACNLNCIGCWASEYNKCDNMDYTLMDRIIQEGKNLGTFMYFFSGGEPLVRKNDLIKLAEKHNDCMFLAFTNGTLIDEEFATEVQRVGNFSFGISIEGFEKETDMRRGTGTYAKAIKAMDILKKYGIGFGFSTCYHSKNAEVVASDEYVDFMIEKGCLFGWYFTYIPLGKDAANDLLATAEQREFMFNRIRAFRETKPSFLMDFWNDGEFVDGCIAGGRRYLHINANGDVEPCAFIHYSNANIKDVSLLEALHSPIFKEYNANQPFNKNHLRPCPLLDNPHMLRKLVHESKAYSTQPIDKEDVDVLTSKCKDVSEKWEEVADKLWKAKK